jgi:hypothetical protein
LHKYFRKLAKGQNKEKEGWLMKREAKNGKKIKIKMKLM